MSWSTQFPDLLVRLHRLEFDHDAIELEPYDEFWPASENADWFRAWTGNPLVDGDAFRVFGMDATGGQVGFWIANRTHDLLQQPIVFLGSEGQIGVIAADLFDYLWLLAGGVGRANA